MCSNSSRPSAMEALLRKLIGKRTTRRSGHRWNALDRPWIDCGQDFAHDPALWISTLEPVNALVAQESADEI